jgi:hypothetical protein
MSHLTLCNFCRLRRIKARAKTDGMVVSLNPMPLSKTQMLDGQDVYVHPPGVKAWAVKQYWAAWMAEIGDKCEC